MSNNKLFLVALIIPLLLILSLDCFRFFGSLDHKILIWQQQSFSSSQDSGSPIVMVRTGKNFDGQEKASFLDNILLTQSVIPFIPYVVTFETFFNNLTKEEEAYVPQLVKRTHRLNQAIIAAQIPPILDSSLAPPSATTFQTLPYRGDLTQLPDYQFILPPSHGVADAGWLGVDFLPYNQKSPLEKVSLFFRVKDKLYPSLALLSYAKFRRVDLSRSKVFLGDEIILCNTQGGMLGRIPLDENNQSWMLYQSYKPYFIETDIATIILASEQSYDGTKVSFDLSKLRKKIILVQKNNPLDSPKILTPLGYFASIDVHAHIINGLLQHAFIKESSTLLRILIISLVGCFGFWIFLFLNKKEALLLLGVNFIVIFFLSNWCLQSFGLWIPLTSIYLGLILCSSSASLVLSKRPASSPHSGI